LTVSRLDQAAPRALPRPALVVLMAGSALMSLLFGALGPVLPLMVADLGPNGAFVAQLMMSTPAMGVIVGGVLSGWLADRMGARRLLLIALGSYALIGSAGLYLSSTPLLLGSRLLLGGSVAAIGTSIDTLLAEFFEAKSRARLLGFQGAVAGVASVAALLSSGVLGQAYGWRAPFAIYLVGIPLLLSAMLIPKRGDRSTINDGPIVIEKTDVLRELAGLWPIWLLLVPVYVALFMDAIQISLLLAKDDVTNATVRAAIIATASITSGLAGAAYGALYVRFSPRLILAGLLAVMAFGYLLIGANIGLGFVTAGVAIGGLAGGTLSPHVAAYLLRRVSPAARSRAIGFMFTMLFVGDFLNPLLIAPVKAWLGIHGAFLLVAALLGAGALVVLAGHRHVARQPV
jgi:MFS family permease